MKKLISLTIFVFIALVSPTLSFAQGMTGFSSSSPDAAAIQSQQQEEQEGKNFLDELNNKTITCSQLKDADFEKIGEYFMGQAMGDTSRHIVMNEMMKGMMGEQGEVQMHIAWGRRGSGCNTSSQGTGFIPMMQMMMGGWPASPEEWARQGGSSPFRPNQSNNSMMGFGFTPFGGFGWIFMILWWVLIIVGIVALMKWLAGQSHGGTHDHEKSPLEILKERYARGEIDKKEFEEKKKDLA